MLIWDRKEFPERLKSEKELNGPSAVAFTTFLDYIFKIGLYFAKVADFIPPSILDLDFLRSLITS